MRTSEAARRRANVILQAEGAPTARCTPHSDIAHLSPLRLHRVREPQKRLAAVVRAIFRVRLATKLPVLWRKVSCMSWVALRPIGAITELAHVEDHTFALQQTFPHIHP